MNTKDKRFADKFFRLQPDETVIYRDGANMSLTGQYAHAVLGDAMLTNKRFLFKSDQKLTKIDKTLVLSVEDIDFVSKTGIPLLTRSLYISCSKRTGKNYRFNVYHLRKWLSAFSRVLPPKIS